MIHNITFYRPRKVISYQNIITGSQVDHTHFGMRKAWLLHFCNGGRGRISVGTTCCAAAADDAALSYDLRSVRAGPPVGPARPVRSGNIVVTFNFASMIFTGKHEGIRWPSPRGAGPAKRSCTPAVPVPDMYHKKVLLLRPLLLC